MEDKQKSRKEEPTQGGWGGRRQGAGRKRQAARAVTFRATQEVVDAMEQHADRGAFLRELTQWAVRARSLWSDAVPLSAVEPKLVPFADVRIACGPPTLTSNLPVETVDIRELLGPVTDTTVVITAQGLSMKDAGVLPGDKLLIDTAVHDPSARQLAVCELNGEYTLKHLVHKNGCFQLVPDNPEFDPIEVKPGDRLNVWGVVKNIIHTP